MFKKVIAGIASVALALGMVALTAGPASAHNRDIDATCTTLHVDLTDYGSNDTNDVKVFMDNMTTPVFTELDFGKNFEQTFNFTPGAASHTWKVVIDSTDNAWDKTETGTVSNCIDDSNVQKPLCHKNGNGTYSAASEKVWNLVKNVENTHGDDDGNNDHDGDIVPEFNYSIPGVSTHTFSRNWSAEGQEIFNNNCAPRAPTVPTWVPGVCTAAGQASSGTATLPAGPWPVGVTYRYTKYTTSPGSYTNVNAPGGASITVAAGQNIQIQARKNGDTIATWTFASGPKGEKCITPASPSVQYKVCTTPGNFTSPWYTVPTSPNFTYKVGATVLVTDLQNPVTPPATITITAVADAGYTFFGQFTWTYVFADPGTCVLQVAPAAATFNDAVCTAVGQASAGSYTIPAALAGTKYQVKFLAGGVWADVLVPGTFPLNVGEDVYIQAVALTGYSLTGDWSWHDVAGGPASADCVAPADPTVTQAKCNGPGTSSQASYTVPFSTGIQYQQWDGTQWVNIGNGTVDVNSFPTTINWQAVAIAPYVIVPGSVTTWELTLASPGDCAKTVTAVADIDQALCAGNGVIEKGEYIISTSEGVYYEVSINDGVPETKAAGTYPVPTGTKVTITAHALPNYALTGDTWWTDTIEVPADCFKVEGDPTFHEGCDVETNTWTSPIFKVVAADHVFYTWSLNGVDQPGTIAVGTHTANAGDIVEITAHADPGFELNENPWEWAHTFADPTGTCQIEPPAPSCRLFDDEGQLPLGPLEHADWVVNGVNKGSGAQNVQLSTSDTTISVVAHEGYEFGEGATTSWTFDLDENGACELPTEATWPASVTHTDEVCTSARSAKGTITVDTVEGEVQYFLNGVAFASSTVSVDPGTYTVTAEPVDPDDALTGVPAAGFWTVVVKPAASTTCDLTTLALTGPGSNPIGWAGIGYYLLVTGLALIAVRTVRRRNEAKQQQQQ